MNDKPSYLNFNQDSMRGYPLSDVVRTILFMKSEEALFLFQKHVAEEAELLVAVSGMVSLYMDLEPKIERFIEKHDDEDSKYVDLVKPLKNLDKLISTKESLRKITYEQVYLYLRCLRAFMEVNGITAYEAKKQIPSTLRKFQ